MSNSNVALLKEHLEELFPGKWLVDSRTQKNIQTGIAEIDQGITHGIARRRITEWVGPISSGKTTFLRSIVAQWCASGMQIVYVDTINRLQAKDWAFVEKGNSGAFPANLIPQLVNGEGKFWVVRNLNLQKGNQNLFWATEQLIRSALFDVVIFDLGCEFYLTSKIYARLQRCLERSRTALILLKDDSDDAVNSNSWGSHARLAFNWTSNISCTLGLSGVVSIIPAINARILKEGMTKNLEVSIQSYVSNRLFTHPQIPDRRTTKT